MKKMQNWVKILQFWYPPNISPTADARNFKFGTETDGSEFLQKKCKIMSKGVMWRSRNPLLEFRDPPNISRTIEATNFKFGTETDGSVF